MYVIDQGDEPGLVEQVKSQICDIWTMYAQKYEEFASNVPEFVTSVRKLLISTGIEVKFDLVRPENVMAGAFLTSSIVEYLPYTCI